MEKQEKVWLIVGGNEGLGLASMKYILSKGAIVVTLTPDVRLFKENTGLSHPNLHIYGYSSTRRKELSQIIANIRAEYGPIDYYLNHQSAEDIARQWEGSKLSIDDFEKVFAFKTVWLSGLILRIMAKSSWAHIFFVSFKEKSEPLERIADARIAAIKDFIVRYDEEFQNWNIKLSMIDEDNLLHNFDDSENVFKLQFSN